MTLARRRNVHLKSGLDAMAVSQPDTTGIKSDSKTVLLSPEEGSRLPRAAVTHLGPPKPGESPNCWVREEWGSSTRDANRSWTGRVAIKVIRPDLPPDS